MEEFKWYKAEKAEMIKKAHIDKKFKEAGQSLEVMMNFWRVGAPHIGIDGNCPVCNEPIEALDLLTERIDYVKQFSESLEIDFEVLELELKGITDQFDTSGKVPSKCPNGHKIYYYIFSGKIEGRSVDLEYDKMIDICKSHGYPYSR